MLRARFEKHKNETDMVRASALLKAGEEEWWVNRHHSPFLLPWAEGGLAFQRQWKNSRAASMMNYWSPEDRARYPDIYEKYEKLQQLRQESWEEEMARLDEHEEELADEGETITDEIIQGMREEKDELVAEVQHADELRLQAHTRAETFEY